MLCGGPRNIGHWPKAWSSSDEAPKLQDCLYLQYLTGEVHCASSLAVLSLGGDFEGVTAHGGPYRSFAVWPVWKRPLAASGFYAILVVEDSGRYQKSYYPTGGSALFRRNLSLTLCVE
jgi:hypothetical protein